MKTIKPLFSTLSLSTQKAILAISMFALLVLAAGCKSEDPQEKFQKLMSQAENFRQNDKWEEARISLLSAVQIDQKNAPAYFMLADTYAHLKNFGQAAENYRNALNFDPEHYEARLHLATLLVAAQQNEVAESHVVKLLEKNPTDSSALVLKANLEKARGAYSDSKETLNKVLELEPDNIMAIANLGAIAMLEGRFDEAEQQFQEALRIDPNNSPVQLALADLYTRQQRMTDAQTLLEGLVKEQPENSSLRYYFGDFLLKGGLADQALNEFRTTLAKDPDNHTARDRLIEMYLSRNETEPALKLIEEVKTIAEDSPIIDYFKGREAEITGNQEGALSFYLSCIQSLPNFAPAFSRAGVIELARGESNQGVEHLNQAVSTNSDDVTARLALARHAFSQKQFAEAKEHLSSILVRYPRHIASNVMMADIYLIEGETDKAHSVYQALVDAFPSHPIGYFKLGMLEEREGNDEAAIKNYKSALKFDINPFSPARRLATLLRRTLDPDKAEAEMRTLREASKHKGQYDYLIGLIKLSSPNRNEQTLKEAKELFLSAASLEPELSQAYLAIAGLDSMLGNTDDAVKNYKLLVEKQPENTTGRILLALSYEKLGDYEKAAEEYRAALKTNPNLGPAANNLAYLILEKLNGNPDEALELAKKAKESMPQDGGVADTVGWAYTKKNSLRVALSYLEEAVTLERSSNEQKMVNPEILYHLAYVQQKLGDTEAAKKSAAEALKHPAIPQEIAALIRQTVEGN